LANIDPANFNSFYVQTLQKSSALEILEKIVYLKYLKKYQDINNPIKLQTLNEKMKPVVILITPKLRVVLCHPNS